MALFSLTYDLRKKDGYDYQKLYDELASFDAVRILESTWAFNRINIKAKGLREHFQTLIHKDDGLFVCELSDWSSVGCKKSPNDLD